MPDQTDEQLVVPERAGGLVQRCDIVVPASSTS